MLGMHESEGEATNLSGVLDDYINNQIIGITNLFSQVRAILDAYPYTNPQAAALNARYSGLKTAIDGISQSQSVGNTIQARAQAEIVKSNVTKLYNDTMAFQTAQANQNQEFYKTQPGAANKGFYSPQTGAFPVFGAGDFMQSMGKALTSSTMGIPNFFLLAAGYLIFFHKKHR
jgi:hypothetical protein